MADITVRYQAVLENPDGSRPYYEPFIPIDTLDDQLTREGAVMQMDAWCRGNGWVWVGDDNRGTLTAPDGTPYIYKIYLMRCSTYTLRYCDEAGCT